MWLIECTLTRQSLSNQKKREKFNKPTTQESSSPSEGECEICANVFVNNCLLNFNSQLKLLKLKGTR